MGFQNPVHVANPVSHLLAPQMYLISSLPVLLLDVIRFYSLYVNSIVYSALIGIHFRYTIL